MGPKNQSIDTPAFVVKETVAIRNIAAFQEHCDKAGFLQRNTKELLDEEGLACPVVSSGGSPDMWTALTNGIVSEYRTGTYIYNDRSLVERGTCTWDDCAGTLVATVASTPVANRAIIDAGSKVLTSDLFLGFSDYGHVLGHPNFSILGLSEEHGTLAVDPKYPLKIGERIRIVPNQVCVVSNIFDQIWLENDKGSLEQVTVDARGRVIQTIWPLCNAFYVGYANKVASGSYELSFKVTHYPQMALRETISGQESLDWLIFCRHRK